MFVAPILKIDSAQKRLPLVNVMGYKVTGKITTIYYHVGPANLNPLPKGPRSRSLSISSAKNISQLEKIVLRGGWYPTKDSFIEYDTIEVDNDLDACRKNSDGVKAAVNAAQKASEQARNQVKLLPEWKACIKRLRQQVKEITSGSFKQDRHDKRRNAAKEEIKNAARSCVSKYYVSFDEIIELTGEALRELEVEDVMEG